MLRTALLIDEAFRDHRNPPGHPEQADRIGALLELGENPGREATVRVGPRPATPDEVRRVHTPAHFDLVAASAGRAFTVFDGDTTAVAESFDTALLAAGGLLETVDAVVEKRSDNGFALVRPPGHHAETDRVMGFCFFNNVAIAARHLRHAHGMDRVAVVDWDVHHGNGTQDAFWTDGNVLFVSLHEFPLYPGTGAAAEQGEGAGQGTTVNVPMAAGGGDDEYRDAMHRTVLPALRDFAPEFLLISAGFDAHRDDPLANMRMTEAGYRDLTRMLLGVAADCCDGRVAAVLEGGYDLAALRASVQAVLLEMAGAAAQEETA